jgi:flagellar biosynthesis protein FlhG
VVAFEAMTASRPGETLYDVLGLDPKASRDQVEKAYRFCFEMYRDGALATYSLLDPDDLQAVRARITEAYEVLADPSRRREYDLSQGFASAGTPLLPFPSPAGISGAEAVGEGSMPPVDFPGSRVTGAELRRVREARGISLREIALVSKIGLRFLEYIEEDRHRLLPATVYLRGFLQEYARALGLDPKATADAYMACMPRQGDGNAGKV